MLCVPGIMRQNLARHLFAMSIMAFSYCADAALVPSSTSAGATNFNAYVFNDFNLNSGSIQGSVYAGGNVSMKNYSLGSVLPWDAIAIASGGDMTLTGGSVNGLLSAGGKLTTSSMAPVKQSSTSPDLATNQVYFSDLSTLLSQTSNGSHYDQWGRLILEGGSSDEPVVVHIDPSSWGKFWGIGVVESDVPQVVVNVPGQILTISHIDWLMKSLDYAYQFKPEQILYNFYEATQLTVDGAMTGSVLAPKANVIGRYGVINGQLIANSFNGSIELRNSTFDLGAWEPVNEPPSTEVSSPALFSVFVILFLFLLLACARRPRTLSLTSIFSKKIQQI